MRGENGKSISEERKNYFFKSDLSLITQAMHSIAPKLKQAGPRPSPAAVDPVHNNTSDYQLINYATFTFDPAPYLGVLLVPWLQNHNNML